LEIKLTHLAKLLEDCWDSAELETAKLVGRKYPAPNEENLTFLFSGELRSMVEQASEARKIESAFLSDLRATIHNLPYRVEEHARGLVARVTFHGRWHEGHRSAADMGIVVTRPIVDVSLGHTRIEFRRDHATGLLAQAKLACFVNAEESRLRWGTLTPSQVRKFSKRSDYYSLLLYRLGGPTRNELKTFGWQLCKGHTSRAAQQWLESDAFPDELSSRAILGRLFARTIGSEDPNALESIIDPTEPGAHAIELHISWPDGDGPPPSMSLQECQNQPQQVRQRA
jgi:hypothetical protein